MVLGLNTQISGLMYITVIIFNHRHTEICVVCIVQSKSRLGCFPQQVLCTGDQWSLLTSH